MDTTRYQRQLQLPGFGREGQQKLADAKVLVIGAGGLGVPVLQYLTGMGVGTLGIVDADQVSLSNLHRQVIYTPADVGQLKVDCCVQKLKKQNQDVQFNTYPHFLSSDNALDIVKDYDLVVDATDNFNARYLINDACVILKKPFVYGALQQFEGHVSVFNHQDGPTYRCLYPEPLGEGQIPDCNTAGVLGIVPGLIGSYQALETIKIITGLGTPLSGVLQISDFLHNSQYQIKLTAKHENKNIRDIKIPETSSFCAADESISAVQLWDWIKGKKAFQLIDVREAQEYQSAHLEAAFSVPLSRLNGQLPDLPKDQPWVLMCQQGGRSKKALQYLKERQPELTLFNFEGGMTEWINHYGEETVVQP
jgi:molybdopterin/thiamine biosynthesis adenylyltransferase/rhodanese-related sulfurtransferase